MASDIRIGTASWTDPGFVADWYPPKLPASDRLRWYAEHFDYVEVNATFYAIPTARTVARWCEQTPDDFLFDVKLPKVLSRHGMRPQFLPPDLRRSVPMQGSYIKLTRESEALIIERFLREIAALREGGKLGAFLLQLSPSFSPRTARLEELDSLFEQLAPTEVAIELRNRGWVTGAEAEATLDYFKSREKTLVMVDAPESEHFTVMPGMECVTNPRLGYFRAHGRNEQGYVRGRTVADRFDYDYNDAEVSEMAKRLERVASEVQELRIVANNNRSNYAPKLALKLREMMGMKERLARRPLQPGLL